MKMQKQINENWRRWKFYGDACQNLSFWENSRVRIIKFRISALQSIGTVALHNLKNFQVFSMFFEGAENFLTFEITDFQFGLLVKCHWEKLLKS